MKRMSSIGSGDARNASVDGSGARLDPAAVGAVTLARSRPEQDDIASAATDRTAASAHSSAHRCTNRRVPLRLRRMRLPDPLFRHFRAAYTKKGGGLSTAALKSLG